MALEERLVDRHALDADDRLVRAIVLGAVHQQERIAVRDPEFRISAMSMASLARGSSVLDRLILAPWFPAARLARQPCGFPEPPLQRSGGKPSPCFAGRHVLEDRRRGADLGARADRQVIGHAGLAAERDSVAHRRAAGNAREGGGDAVATEPDVVGDMDEIVDLGVLADRRIAKSAPIHAAVGADRHPVLQDHPPQLRQVDDALGSAGRAESRLADHRAGVDRHPITDQGEADHRIGADAAVAAEGHARPDHHAGRQIGPATDPGPLPDDHARRQDHALLQLAVGMDVLRAVVTARGVQASGGGGPRGLRMAGQQQRAAGRSLVRVLGPQEAGGAVQARKVDQALGIGQEGDGARAGALERGDVRDQMPAIGRIGQPSAAQAGQFREGRRTQVFEKARVRHWSSREQPGRHARADSTTAS